MLDHITQSYTGADATGEIFFMLAVAIFLGWLLRIAWERFIYDDIVIDDHVHDSVVDKDIQKNTPKDVQEVHNTAISITQHTETALTPTPTPTPAPILMSQPMPHQQDDLKIVEGIGPKIQALLQEGGINTWQDLAQSDPNDIKTLLRSAGERYRIHDPSTWPEQAQLAYDHKWDELREFQNFLSGGKIVG